MYKKIFLTLVVTSGLLAVNFFVARNFLENSYFDVLYQPLSFFNQKVVAMASYGRSILHVADLSDKISVLEQENGKLLTKVSHLNALEEENQILRTRLNLAPNSKHQLIFATIFNLRGGETFSRFMVDKGSSEGIENGLAVITAEGILAGIVSKTYTHSALVLMPQNKDLSLDVKISGTNIFAKSRGDGNQAVLDYVTSQEPTKTDDLVVTSGLDNIPEAIPVFKVIAPRSVVGGLFQSVAVVPIFRILETFKVFVIK